MAREPRGAETTAERQTETYIQRDRDTEGQRWRQKEDEGTRWSSRQTKSQEKGKEGNEAEKEKILTENGQAQSPRGRVGRIESDRTEKGRWQGPERTIRETNRQRLTDERSVCTWQ